MPVNNVIPSINIMVEKGRLLNSRCFLAISLKNGRSNSAINKANINEINVSRIDSPKNCLAICDLVAPITFLMPTSVALFADLAVARFIKLIQAIMRINNAIIEKIITSFILPPDPVIEYR
jgi:hypothetical protein